LASQGASGSTAGQTAKANAGKTPKVDEVKAAGSAKEKESEPPVYEDPSAEIMGFFEGMMLVIPYRNEVVD
jgi:hypothetical protein